MKVKGEVVIGNRHQKLQGENEEKKKMTDPDYLAKKIRNRSDDNNNFYKTKPNEYTGLEWMLLM